MAGWGSNAWGESPWGGERAPVVSVLLPRFVYEPVGRRGSRRRVRKLREYGQRLPLR